MKEIFRFKRFEVEQSVTAGMKVGTDGVLLAAWCSEGGAKLLDVGAGTGVIALILAQRNPDAHVYALDVDAECCRQASSNAARSPWSGRITVINEPVQSHDPQHRYDHIVSNPPFFTESLTPPSDGRKTARHTTLLTHEELAGRAAALLSPQGRFSVILPPAPALAMQKYAAGQGLHLRRLTEVAPRREAAAKRVMMEFGFEPAASGCEISRIDIMERAEDSFTEEYRALTHDFYLKF